MTSITEIKNSIKDVPAQALLKTIAPYKADERAGVQALVQSAENRYRNHLSELNRLHHMKRYERKYKDALYICGVDEAGRGPLCGPVVAAAVMLPKDCEILYLNDSKQVRASLREMLYHEIMEKAISVSVGFGDVQLIDEINILNATYVAMEEAVNGLATPPEVVLVDAVTIPRIPMLQEAIIEGDQKSVSIAAASIIAKVTRDRMMVDYATLYPGYGFEQHKGYGTKLHIEALKHHGPCPIHRQSFIKNLMI